MDFKPFKIRSDRIRIRPKDPDLEPWLEKGEVAPKNPWFTPDVAQDRAIIVQLSQYFCSKCQI